MQRAFFTCLGVAMALNIFGTSTPMPSNESLKIWMDDGYGGMIYVDNPDCNATYNGERVD